MFLSFHNLVMWRISFKKLVKAVIKINSYGFIYIFWPIRFNWQYCIRKGHKNQACFFRPSAINCVNKFFVNLSFNSISGCHWTPKRNLSLCSIASMTPPLERADTRNLIATSPIAWWWALFTTCLALLTKPNSLDFFSIRIACLLSKMWFLLLMSRNERSQDNEWGASIQSI